MIIYLCIKFQSNIPILSKDIVRKPKVLRTGQTGRTDGQRRYYMPPIENGGGIKTTKWMASSVDPHQMPHSATSDVWTVYSDLSLPLFKVNMACLCLSVFLSTEALGYHSFLICLWSFFLTLPVVLFVHCFTAETELRDITD